MSAIRFLPIYQPPASTDATGTVDQTGPAATQSITGTHPFTGTVSQSALSAIQSISGSSISNATGSVAQVAPVAVQSVAGAETFSGAIAQAAAAAVQDVAGGSSLPVSGTVVQVGPGAQQSIAGQNLATVFGTVSAVLGPAIQALVGAVTNPPLRNLSHRNRIHSIGVHTLRGQPELPLGGGLVIKEQPLPLLADNRGDGLLRIDTGDGFLLVNADG